MTRLLDLADFDAMENGKNDDQIRFRDVSKAVMFLAPSRVDWDRPLTGTWEKFGVEDSDEKNFGDIVKLASADRLRCMSKERPIEGTVCRFRRGPTAS